MPKKDVTVNLPGIVVKQRFGANPLRLICKSVHRVACPHCFGKRLRQKARIRRTVRHESIGDRVMELVLEGHKYYCRDCGRYFNQRFAGIAPHCKASQKLKEQLFRRHKLGVSNKDLAILFGLSQSTIERYLHEFYYLQNQKLAERTCPRILGIDEHRFSKRQPFATTFCDLRKHKVFDVVKGKSGKALCEYLSQLSGRDKVKVICIDLCHPYRKLIKQYFPNAKIVADRFHVVRIINHHFMKTCQSIDPKIRYQRGILRVLRTRPDRLKAKDQERLEDYFKAFPTIKALYDKKQEIHKLMLVKHQTAEQCRREHIPKLVTLIEQLKQIAFDQLKTLAKTLEQWKNEIACMWRFTKTNGITEGFHRKMKLIQRRAYGFRNFENYRMRVRILCA